MRPKDPGRGAALPEVIVLVGFMASGKSTVGRRLARRLGYDFVDLDREVERRAGRAIPEIFRESGEETFRELEAAVTRDLDGLRGMVVAVGGGWMARPELRDRWPGACRVWLGVGAETVLRRVGDDLEGRPMLDPEDPDGSVRRLLEERRPEYEKAEIRVATDDLTPEQVVARILAELQGGTPGPAALNT